MNNDQDEVSIAELNAFSNIEPEIAKPIKFVENPFTKINLQISNLNDPNENVWSELPPFPSISKHPIVSSPDMALPHPRRNSMKNCNPLLRKLSKSEKDQPIPNVIIYRSKDLHVCNESEHLALDNSIGTKSTGIADKQSNVNKMLRFEAYSSPLIEKDLKRINGNLTNVNTVLEDVEQSTFEGYKHKCCFII